MLTRVSWGVMEGRKERGRSHRVFRRMAMQCLCSGEQANLLDENGEIELYANNDGLREAELSLQEGGSLNYYVGALIFLLPAMCYRSNLWSPVYLLCGLPCDTQAVNPYSRCILSNHNDVGFR